MRNSNDFITFLKKEMPGKEISWYSADKNEGILFHGKKQNSGTVLKLLTKYIENFVVCPSCKKMNTIIDIDHTSKFDKFICQQCGFTKYV